MAKSGSEEHESHMRHSGRGKPARDGEARSTKSGRGVNAAGPGESGCSYPGRPVPFPIRGASARERCGDAGQEAAEAVVLVRGSGHISVRQFKGQGRAER